MEKLESLWSAAFIITLLALFFCCASGPRTASASTGDHSISKQVSMAIFHEPMLRTSFLNVKTSNGVVQLTGNVERPVEVEIAKELAATVPGVVEVHAELVTVRDHTATGR